MKKVYHICLALLLWGCHQQGSTDGITTVFSGHSGNQNQGLQENTLFSSLPYLSPEEGWGKMQSPINIITGRASGAKHHILLHYEQSKEVLKNLGHTVQLMYDDGSYIMIDSQQYDLEQIHFHTPSEHLIDGITYPLEMHMVHVFHDEALEGNNPHYLVVGALFREGRENAFLADFMENLPEKEGQTVELANRYFNINSLIKEHFNSFYHYKGSLTTHPYTESVNWLVLKHVFEASPEQIEKLNKLEGNNARHIQALNNREIEEVWY